jgi:signal transduction histidine kinase
VFNNLIANAVKFSHHGSVVTIEAKREDNTILLSVTDQGEGIPPDELNKLFKPFSRTSIKSTAGEKSSGLGLAIARRIVEGHQGQIWVESRVGQGTKFFVSFPIRGFG